MHVLLTKNSNMSEETKLTPRAKVERGELRNVIFPLSRSEKRSDQNTKYSDIDVIKIAWIVDNPLPKQRY